MDIVRTIVYPNLVYKILENRKEKKVSTYEMIVAEMIVTVCVGTLYSP